jgi:hypothetical protein
MSVVAVSRVPNDGDPKLVIRAARTCGDRDTSGYGGKEAATIHGRVFLG